MNVQNLIDDLSRLPDFDRQLPIQIMISHNEGDEEWEDVTESMTTVNPLGGRVYLIFHEEA